MDFTRNADKIIEEDIPGVSYATVNDVVNDAVVAVEPVLLAQFKLYAKIDLDDDDTLIGSLLIAARRMCEQYCNQNFTARTVTAYINNLNGGNYLPYGPIGAISSIVDVDGNVLDSDQYKIAGGKWKQVVAPRWEYLAVTYTGGWVTCPDELINAVKAQCLFLYENRGEDAIGMSPVATMILQPLRRVA